MRIEFLYEAAGGETQLSLLFCNCHDIQYSESVRSFNSLYVKGKLQRRILRSRYQ